MDAAELPRYLTECGKDGRELPCLMKGTSEMRNERTFGGVFPGAALAGCCVLACSLNVEFGRAQQTVPQGDAAPGVKAAPKSTSDEVATQRTTEPALPIPAGAKKLSPTYPVWLDARKKAVLVDGQICLREGMLEMFACTRNTKEHEAIVSADTKAFIVHAALLSLGAEAGHPVQFEPTFKPPAGTEIEVSVQWRDGQGKERSARAQDWVRDVHTKKAMEHSFVFGGSSFWIDPSNGKKHYQAEGGDFVCVSNFGTAMLDIPVKSSQANESLEFEAFTERIPPLGTPVRLIFQPQLNEPGAGSTTPGVKTDGNRTTTRTNEAN